jgi:tetratricopeptide (TPR) repeat protein
MELVKGVPITRFCDERRLTPRERLGLFVPVCQAVQHAHQKGVIHRDLKPNNVLVALYDGRPVPKVIDFGVAKATGQPLTEKTLVTGLGAVVGTPEYMSPEQAELNQLDVDTRSDVYSLGVLLYELLTGTTPLQTRRVKQAALLEVLRLVREEEPPRPSTRLSTTAELPAIAADRGVEPDKLSRLVRGELDWIVMKALEKDRNRRYDTATGLATDIQRYLADEPVAACPPTVGYRVRKFARRHKRPVAAASALLFLLLAGLAGTGWGLVNADRARRDAEAAAASERAARAAEADHRRQAEAHFQVAVGAVDDYLTAVADDPLLRRSDFHRLRKRLLEAAVPYLTKLTAAAPGSTVLEAERGRSHGRLAGLHEVLGERSEALAGYEKARAVFLQLTAEHPAEPRYRQDLAGCLTNLGLLLKGAGRGAEAEAALREALALRRRLADDHPDEPKYRREVAAAHGNLGTLLRVLGRPAEAEAEARAALAGYEALAAGHPDDPEYQRSLATALNNLAAVLGDTPPAQAARLEALDVRARLAAANPDRPEYRQDLGRAHSNLGALLHNRKESGAAEPHLREAVAVQERLVADFPAVAEHRQDLARSRHNLGLVLKARKQGPAAVASFRAALAVREKLAVDAPAVPDYQNELGATLTHLADATADAGDAAEARQLLVRAAQHHQAAVTQLPDHPAYRTALRSHDRTRADVFLRLRDHAAAADAAEALARHAVDPAADAYNAARRLAYCATLAASDPGLPEADRAEVAGRYADRAVALLRRAAASGYRDATYIKRDDFLDPLRGRDDFRRLLAEMERANETESDDG